MNYQIHIGVNMDDASPQPATEYDPQPHEWTSYNIEFSKLKTEIQSKRLLSGEIWSRASKAMMTDVLKSPNKEYALKELPTKVSELHQQFPDEFTDQPWENSYRGIICELSAFNLINGLGMTAGLASDSSDHDLKVDLYGEIPDTDKKMAMQVKSVPLRREGLAKDEIDFPIMSPLRNYTDLIDFFTKIQNCFCYGVGSCLQISYRLNDAWSPYINLVDIPREDVSRLTWTSKNINFVTRVSTDGSHIRQNSAVARLVHAGIVTYRIYSYIRRQLKEQQRELKHVPVICILNSNTDIDRDTAQPTDEVLTKAREEYAAIISQMTSGTAEQPTPVN
jgi:hypothetical protein